MLKIKRIEVKGFRGLPGVHELPTVSGRSPASLVLFGPNSSGKTSFVDGLEWFFSRSSKIEWLDHVGAMQAAYPHQAADDTHVEVEFADPTEKLETLRKTYDRERITLPQLSSENDFEHLYDSFVISPHLRYMEIIEFILDTPVEKYKKLAGWMGLEDELAMQEKMAKGITTAMRNETKRLKEAPESHWASIVALVEKESGQECSEADVVTFVNLILERHKLPEIETLNDLSKRVEELPARQSAAGVDTKFSKLAQAEDELKTIKLSPPLTTEVNALLGKISKFIEESGAQSVDAIDLYNKALTSIGEGEEVGDVNCPVCGTKWNQEELLQHIRQELESLKDLKEERQKLLESAQAVRSDVEMELGRVAAAIKAYKKIEEATEKLEFPKAESYHSALNGIKESLTGSIFAKSANVIDERLVVDADSEKSTIEKAARDAKVKFSGDEKEKERLADFSKLSSLLDAWNQHENTRREQEEFLNQLESLKKTMKAVDESIQEDFRNHFEEISSTVQDYFQRLRADKEITDIRIIPASGRAATRTAEIELSYFDIAVTPAYKILSESLLNSLGLALYFACIKKYNTQCGFMVLDDIMNSLDIHHRGTLTNLIDEEFSEYQIILFTHDKIWFERIGLQLRQWVRKRVRDWNYASGPIIDFAQTTKEGLEKKLADDLEADAVATTLGDHEEGVLNEICELLEVKVRHRYYRADLPMLYELFVGLESRLKKLPMADDSVLKAVQKAKGNSILTRNSGAHDRRSYPSSITSTEVKEAADIWFDEVEAGLRCSSCHKLVGLVRVSGNEHVMCGCGKTKLT